MAENPIGRGPIGRGPIGPQPPSGSNLTAGASLTGQGTLNTAATVNYRLLAALVGQGTVACQATVSAAQGETLDGGYVRLTREDVFRYRRYLKDVEEAQERSKHKRKKLEARLDGTIRRAYALTQGEEEADLAEAVVEAIETAVPEAVIPAIERYLPPQIDWRAFFASVGALERTLSILERQTQRIDESMLREEEDVELLMLAL